MTDDSYSIKEMISEFRKDITEHLGRIEAQTTKTNGRVNSLERSRVQIWTAITVASIFTGALIMLSIYAIETKIKKGIADALEENISKIEIDEN